MKTEKQEHIGVLYTRYTHLILGLCLKYLKDEDVAKDAVMDIFEKMPSLLQKHQVTNFKSWLYSVSKNHCLMQMRKDKSHLDIDMLNISSENFMEKDESEHLSKEKELMNLEKAIDQLEEGQKQCIKLFYLNEKSYSEVVMETGFDMNKVKSYIQNGKRNLKIILTKNSIVFLLMIIEFLYWVSE